eukprot:scaffold99749_cov39-Phaeocystis_antarctica.AAC.1
MPPPVPPPIPETVKAQQRHHAAITARDGVATRYLRRGAAEPAGPHPHPKPKPKPKPNPNPRGAAEPAGPTLRVRVRLR